MTTTEREVDPRLKRPAAPGEGVPAKESTKGAREQSHGADVPFREVTQVDRQRSHGERPKRAHDSIMDYIPSTTMGKVIRPPPVRRIAVLGAAAAFGLLAVGVLVAFGMSPGAPTVDWFVPFSSTPPAVAATSPERPDTSSAVLDDEVADDEIVILDDEDEIGAQGARKRRAAGAKRPKRHRRRNQQEYAERPSPGATFTELDRLTVRKTIRSRIVHLHRCYDKALSRNPDLAGRLEIEITIGVRGRVTQAAIMKDTLRHDPTASCIVAKLMGWKFHINGWLRHPVEVSFPVSFSG